MYDKLDLTNASAFDFCKSASETIADICQPFFKATGLTSFIYGRVFFDGRYLGLTNEIEWIKNWFQDIHTIADTAFHTSLLQTPLHVPNYSLWSFTSEDKIIQFNNRFNLWHGFDIHYRLEDSLEVWCFATSKESHQLNNFYLNNLKLFHHFCLYFREKAASFMETNVESRLAVFKEHFDLSYHDSVSLKANFNAFIGSFPLTRYSLHTKNGKAKLSKRELECMFHISQGKTAKEIGKLLNLSNRTIEFYIGNIKQKTGYQSKSALGDLFREKIQKML